MAKTAQEHYEELVHLCSRNADGKELAEDEVFKNQIKTVRVTSALHLLVKQIECELRTQRFFDAVDMAEFDRLREEYAEALKQKIVTLDRDGVKEALVNVRLNKAERALKAKQPDAESSPSEPIPAEESSVPEVAPQTPQEIYELLLQRCSEPADDSEAAQDCLTRRDTIKIKRVAIALSIVVREARKKLSQPDPYFDNDAVAQLDRLRGQYTNEQDYTLPRSTVRSDLLDVRIDQGVRREMQEHADRLSSDSSSVDSMFNELLEEAAAKAASSKAA
jgi:hypothetical protein